MASADARGRALVGEEALAQVAEERRPLAVEVGDGQVGPAVAVEVAAGRRPSPPGSRPPRCRPRPASRATLLEPEAAQVAEEVVGRHVVGDVEVDPAVVVEVGGDHAQPAAVRIDAAGTRRSRRRTGRRRCGRRDRAALRPCWGRSSK